MSRTRWSVLALVTLTTACAEQPTTMFAPPEAGPDEGPRVVASESELRSILEAAHDPYLAELMGALGEADRGHLTAALGGFGAGVLTAPTPSYRSLESVLFTFGAGAPEMNEDSDAALVLEVLDLFRTWSEQTLYGVED